MNPPMTYDYRGQSMTISELARLTGVKWRTFYNRLHVSKLTVEEAVHMPFRHHDYTDIVRKRQSQRKLETVKEITSPPEKSSGGVTYRYRDVTDTIAGWSRRTGINRTTLTMRLQAGWTIERALTEAVLGRSKYKLHRNAGVRP